MSKLTLTLQGENQAVVTRHFAASPERIYQAHVDPELLRQWATGPDGWEMVDCQSDPRPGGAIRYEWRNVDGHGFHLTGEYVSLEPHTKIAHIERMHLPDPTPDNHVVTTFEPSNGGTLLTMTMTLPDQATRDAMLATGMADGMEDSYVRMEGLLAD